MRGFPFLTLVEININVPSKMHHDIVADNSSNDSSTNAMEDIPVPAENTFDVTLPATHSVSIHLFIFRLSNWIFVQYFFHEIIYKYMPSERGL